MEQIKGGGLVNLPDAAKAVFDRLDPNASYALRFAGFIRWCLQGSLGNEYHRTDERQYQFH